MRPSIALACALALSGCARAPSTFAFDLEGDVSTRARSSATAHGSVDDAGYLALDDEAWGIRIALGGLAPGSRTVAKGSGDLVLMSKVTGDVFTSDLGTTCTVWVDPHDATNGSPVTGWFTCDALGSSTGKRVGVQGGRFATFLDDASNDPNVAPPTGAPATFARDGA